MSSKQIPLYVPYCSILTSIKVLFFQTCEKALHRAVIIRASRFAHTAPDPVLGQHCLIAVAAVLASPVTVENQWIIFLFPMKGIPQRLACEFPALGYFIRFSPRKKDPSGSSFSRRRRDLKVDPPSKTLMRQGGIDGAHSPVHTLYTPPADDMESYFFHLPSDEFPD